jgi:hypothetical protein
MHHTLTWAPRHSFQGRNLTEKLLAWLRRTAKQNRARRSIRYDASLGTDLGALADAQMPRHCRLAAHLHEVLERRRAGDADLGHDHAATPEANIVADLNEVIDASPRANDGVTL